MKRTLLKFLEPVGTLLALAGMVAIGWRMHTTLTPDVWTQFSAKRLGTLAMVALLSSVWPLVLARGWQHMLTHLGLRVTTAWTTRTYVRAHLARYLPGNIFQFAARQATGVAAGLPGAPLAKSAVLELAVQVAVGAAFLPLAAPLLLPHIPQTVALVTTLVLQSVLVGLCIRFQSMALGRAMWTHAAAQLFYAWLSLTVLFLVGHPPMQLLPALLGAQIAAWLLGLVVPGAPAGLGVREAVLVVLLRGHMAEPEILLGAVFSRVVTMVGDVLCFAYVSRQPDLPPTDGRRG